jgi:hypothetical protein
VINNLNRNKLFSVALFYTCHSYLAMGRCIINIIVVLGPLFVLLFINDLPLITSKNATLVLYADDTSLIITGSNPVEFCTKVNQSLLILMV